MKSARKYNHNPIKTKKTEKKIQIFLDSLQKTNNNIQNENTRKPKNKHQ